MRLAVQPAVSIVIVSFNAGELLLECVRAALSSTVPVEVLLVDNGSGDGSVYRLRREVQDERLKIIENFANLGFARATNIGIAEARGAFVLLLNPDCILQPDTLERMLEVLEGRSDVGMAGCLIRNRDGSEQAGCRRMVPTPVRSLVRMLHLDRAFPFLKEKGVLLHQTPLPDAPVEVEAISGAFMLVRRQALEDVGLMDEAYFLHCEDLDWCMRFRARGWKILFVPDVAVMHEKGGCSSAIPVRVEWHKHRGMVYFYRKFFRRQYPVWMLWLVFGGVWLRFGLLSVAFTVRRLVR